MTEFINKTDMSVDMEQIRSELEYAVSQCPWEWSSKPGIGNSLGLNYRPGALNPWADSFGSLYDKETQQLIGTELDYSEWHPEGLDYTKEKIFELAERFKFKVGRCRYLRLMPKTGLSIHTDMEPRFHLAIETNPKCLIARTVTGQEESALCYHIPADGFFYKVDTTKEHFVFNGSWEPRIHLVIAAV